SEFLCDQDAAAATEFEDSRAGPQMRAQDVEPTEVRTIAFDHVAAIGARDPVVTVPDELLRIDAAIVRVGYLIRHQKLHLAHSPRLDSGRSSLVISPLQMLAN